MKSVLLSAVALVVFTTSAMAAGLTGTAVPETRRAAVDDAADQSDCPSAPLKVVIPVRAVDAVAIGGTQIQPGDDVASAPALETLPAIPVEPEPDVATYQGREVGGKVVWCIDRSGSMGMQDPGITSVEDYNGNAILNPTRLQIAKVEVINTLVKLKATDQYAIVFFGGYPQTSADPNLFNADETGIQRGINRLNMAHSGYNTPTKLGLNLAMTNYGSDLSQLFFLSDGVPTVGPGPTEIVAWFPGAFASLANNGCQFHVTHMGDNSLSLDFMQNLANSVGAGFTKR